MGAPGPVRSSRGRRGWTRAGVTEDICCGAPAEGLLTIWLKEATLPIMRSRPTSACGSWWAEAWAPGPRRQKGRDKEDYFFNLLSLFGPCSSLLALPLTLPSHTRHPVCYPAWPVPRVQLSAQLLQSGQAFPAHALENCHTLPQFRPLSSAPGAG